MLQVGLFLSEGCAQLKCLSLWRPRRPTVHTQTMDCRLVPGKYPAFHQRFPNSSFQALPGSYLNGTLTVNTSGIRTEVNCVNPNSLNLSLSGSNYTAQATFPNSCSASFSFAGSNGNRQYSVTSAGNCGFQDQGVEFQPVVFWYYFQDTSTGSAPQVAAVFCQPVISVMLMQTSMDLSNGTLGNCTILGNYVKANNVTGNPLNGETFNG